ncbi:MAG: Cysteine--tRNA ligase [Parcubacteria group bacterium ADurb.Bin216]|nr:MAG: Cysteine--tRNA ligase [Parcubacteria group bacterium ADurb.Bin216]
MIYLYNTLTKKKEEFKPIEDNKVGIYTCGPTVYWFAHVGNLRTYIFEDILKRVLILNGYELKHVMNITDVGHLTSDSDSGEDKLEKGAKAEQKSVWEIAQFYTDRFLKDIKMLNIQDPDVLVKATDTIPEQIGLVKILEEKGYTYTISDGVYFDTSKLEKYGKLWGENEKTELRGRIEEVKEKRNPTDFALWKFSPKNEKRQMEWESPWGIGFPGWHTECVVMSLDNLGIPFDIHCGGIDHVSIHHTNEIAQAEAAYGKMMANFWMHGEFLNVKEGKMSKSLGNIITVSDLINKGISPLAYRYLCLNTHYRQKLTFSDESLTFSQTTLEKLYDKAFELSKDTFNQWTTKADQYQNDFLSMVNDDLNMPSALALMWDILKDKDISDNEKYTLLNKFDKVFGLRIEDTINSKDDYDNEKIIIKMINEEGLMKWSKNTSIIPEETMVMINKRIEARMEKQWTESDRLRDEIISQGWMIEDKANQTILKRLVKI